MHTNPCLRVALLLALCACACVAWAAPPRVLVFTKTSGFRHDSIPTAVAALQRLGAQEAMAVDHSEDGNDFTPANLARYGVVIFANTTADVLDEPQQRALEGFVRAGGGFMGVHSATDTEYDWAWYGELVGARFKGHPPGLQSTQIGFEGHWSAASQPWPVTDEIYNFHDNPRERVQVLATVDESHYAGGTMGDDHPIAWCHAFDGGRSWYMGLGHDPALYADPVFLKYLQRGLRYTAGSSEQC